MFKLIKRWRSARPLPVNENWPLHMKVGTIGENAAVKYYFKNGFTILYRNVKIGDGEIDILAEGKDCFVFCEVKTRIQKESDHPLSNRRPAAAVTRKKQLNLIGAASHFVKKYKKKGKKFRFDVMEVFLSEDLSVLRLHPIRNAFSR